MGYKVAITKIRPEDLTAYPHALHARDLSAYALRECGKGIVYVSDSAEDILATIAPLLERGALELCGGVHPALCAP